MSNSTRPTPLSGFPEWLPGDRIVEQYVLDRFRDVFELHGFASVETRAVEPVDRLLAKGETSKEIYLLRRLQAAPESDESGDAGLGLHFDLTVPFARYVLENAGRLQFPFRRYQIQRVWRGERPQEGRYREFTQADIDIIDKDTLPFHYEIELPLVIGEALGGLPLGGPVRIQVNNRKLLEGFYRGLGIEDTQATLRTVDKLDKLGADKTRQELVDAVGCTEAQASACVELAEISSADGSFADRVRALGVRDDLLDEGLDELTRVVEGCSEQMPGLVVADLRIARGLDYYTGTVYETLLGGSEHLGSICSGGRYDALASDGKTTYPGVGISVGVTRLLGPLFARGVLAASRPVPTCVLVALPSEDVRPACMRTASGLRARGIPAEVAPAPAKFGKQIRFADRRGIPYVWFPGVDGAPDEVKDIRSGEQTVADAETWAPPEADLKPTIQETKENS